MSEALVEAIGLTRLYRVDRSRVVRALDHVDMNVGRGTTLGLVGESGSGRPRSDGRWSDSKRPRKARSCSKARTLRAPPAKGWFGCGSRDKSYFRIRRGAESAHDDRRHDRRAFAGAGLVARDARSRAQEALEQAELSRRSFRAFRMRSRAGNASAL